jgi:hypothetical protein
MSIPSKVSPKCFGYFLSGKFSFLCLFAHSGIFSNHISCCFHASRKHCKLQKKRDLLLEIEALSEESLVQGVSSNEGPQKLSLNVCVFALGGLLMHCLMVAFSDILSQSPTTITT